ncbi:ABC transporter permease [Anaerotignum sp.]|uniref:ABC transporter permease n=1 Tax=Anaerotignum sp. TaxID=2039241 RepID=UPI002714D1B3|nr:ABC transporter permease [Anaerotignum sp.]
MNFVKRAMLYVTRKRGKSILLLVILLIMSSFVLTGLAIGKASENTQEDLRKALGGEFQVNVSYSEDNPYFKTEPVDDGIIMYSEMPITQKVISSIMNVPGIESNDATSELLLSVDDVDFIPGNIPIENAFKSMANTMIVGNSQNNSYFTSGQIKLIEGKHIGGTDSHVAIISKELAIRNGLSIGNTLTLQSDNSVDVKIIGLFEMKSDDSILAQVTSYDKLKNKIFFDLNTLQQLSPDRTAGFDTVTFKATDPAELERIMEQVKNLSDIDWKAFSLSADNQTYMQAAAPLEKLNGLVVTMLIVTVVVSAIILSLILTMWAKNRIHETGVLLAVGIGKASILGQYFVEVLLIAVLAFGFSFFTSNIIANDVCNGLLQKNTQNTVQNEISSDDNKVTAAVPEGAGGTDALAQTPKAESIHVSVDIDSLIQLCFIGFAVIILSVGISGATIMRLKPREILSKMS